VKLLIDTQVFVWLTEEDKRLGTNALEKITDVSNTVHISYFSFFEMAIKASIGKMKYDNSIMEDLSIMGLELIIPDRLVLGRYKIYNSDNKDPFDNALISVSIGEKCTFVTSDSKILTITEPGLLLLDAKH
jgi:PIN domain nuclease of toxin-antitoxin system